MPRLPLGDWVDSGVNWLVGHLSWLFDAIKAVMEGMYSGIDAVLGAPTPLLMAGILAVLAWWLRGLLAGVLAFAGFALVDSLQLWDQAMSTLALVLVATVIARVISIPLGIWAARSKAVGAAVRPVLDLLQTMPSMVLLIPAMLFFGLGTAAGVVATLIFALAPGVRMTELGIRQVDAELVEAAEAFGTTPRNILWRVQLPLALPTIMAGVNQVIMLGLSMVVIAGMVGTGGLGGAVNEAIGQLDIGYGFEAGVGIVVLALAAGGIGVFGPNGTTSEASGTDVGKGKEIKIGYIPWDEGIASTFLWKEILQERGFKVTTTQYAAGPLYTGLATGQIDFETDSWLPTTHAEYWKKYGKQLDDIGKWYGPTSLELSVPSYVKDVNSLADLKAHASEFGGKIVGIEPSAGEMSLLKTKVLKEYGLSGSYQVIDGSTPAMLAELKRAYARKQPVLVTLWSPHWAYSSYDLKKLQDPKGAWGKGDGVHTLSRKGFAGDNPQVADWLKNFSMTEKQLTGLEAKIQGAGKGKEQDAVRSWLRANPGLVDKWAPVSGTQAKG